MEVWRSQPLDLDIILVLFSFVQALLIPLQIYDFDTCLISPLPSSSISMSVKLVWQAVKKKVTDFDLISLITFILMQVKYLTFNHLLICPFGVDLANAFVILLLLKYVAYFIEIRQLIAFGWMS